MTSPLTKIPKRWEFHPERHGPDLRQGYGVRHAVYTYEDPEALATDDLAGDPGLDGQSSDGCLPALPHQVRGRHFGARGPGVLINRQMMTP